MSNDTIFSISDAQDTFSATSTNDLIYWLGDDAPFIAQTAKSRIHALFLICQQMMIDHYDGGDSKEASQLVSDFQALVERAAQIDA